MRYEFQDIYELLFTTQIPILKRSLKLKVKALKFFNHLKKQNKSLKDIEFIPIDLKEVEEESSIFNTSSCESCF